MQLHRVFLFCTLGLVAAISAAQDIAEPAATATPTKPTAGAQTHNERPVYPALSKRMGEQGRVEVKVLVDTQGMPVKAEIGRSSGYPRLDASAIDAVMRWRFQPARRNGVAQATWAFVPINFSQDGPPSNASAWNDQAAAAIRSHFRLEGISQVRAGSPASFFVDILPDGTITDKAQQGSSGEPEWDSLAARILDKVHIPPNRFGLIPRKALISMASNQIYVTALTGWQEQRLDTEQRYEDRVAAKIRGRLAYLGAITGNLHAEVELRLLPDGSITGRRLAQSSGNQDWDDEVLRAVDRTRFVPRDVGGRVPPSLTIAFRPQD